MCEGPNKALIDALLKEYDNLTRIYERYGAAGFTIGPLVISGGAVLLSDITKSVVPMGLIVEYIMAFLLAFYGVCHSVINCAGLRLVEIELQINAELGVDNDHGMHRHIVEVGEGLKIIPGFRDHYMIIFLVVSGLFAISFLRAFFWVQTAWSPFTYVLVLLIPVGLIILSLLVMRRIETSTVQKKRELIAAGRGKLI